MPTFDPANPKSAEAATLYHLRDLLAEVEAFQELCGASGKAEALEQIVYGVHPRPVNDEYTEEELAALGCEAHLHVPLEEEAQALLDEAVEGAVVGGVYDLDIRRYVRPDETADHEDRADLWLWFYDCVCAIQHALVAAYASRECPRVSQVETVVAAAWGSFEDQPMQGEYLWSKFRISWGDLDLE